MSWISRLIGGNELERARAAAQAARERAEQEGRDFESWAEQLHADASAVKTDAQRRLDGATAAAARGDVEGFREARARAEEAQRVFRTGRASLTTAHPREAALLHLAGAREALDRIRDIEERSRIAAELAELQARAGDVEGCLATARSVTEPADRASVRRAVAIARAAREGFDAARSTIEGMDDDWNRAEAHLAIAEDACQRGRLALARELAEGLEVPEMRFRAWRLVVAAEARAGRIDAARATLPKIEDPVWTAAASSDIAIALAAAGDRQAGLDAARRIEVDEWRETALAGIVDLDVEARRLEDARELASTLEDARFRDEAWSSIAVAHARAGNTAGALEQLAEIGDEATRAQALVSLARASKQAGKTEEADSIVQRALATADELARRQNSARAQRLPGWLTRFVLEVHASTGNLEAAENVVRIVDQQSERVVLLGQLALHVVANRSGHPLLLEDLLERFPDAPERVAILQHGAIGLLLEKSAAAPLPASDAPAPPSVGDW